MFVSNVLRGMTIKNGVAFQGVLDKMTACFNARLLFVDTDGGLHSADTFLQAAAQVSRIEPQTLHDLAWSPDRALMKRVQVLAEETRRILTMWGAYYIRQLIAWEVTKHGKEPRNQRATIRLGDVVVSLEGITRHHYRSARRAVGRVTDVSKDGQSFTLQMVSGGPGDRTGVDPPTRHRKHLVLLARCADNMTKPLDVDVLTDSQVTDVMTQDRGKLTSMFHQLGLEKVPPLDPILHSDAEFMDFQDEAIEADYLTKLTVLDEGPPDAGDNPREQVVEDAPLLPPPGFGAEVAAHQPNLEKDEGEKTEVKGPQFLNRQWKGGGLKGLKLKLNRLPTADNVEKADEVHVAQPNTPARSGRVAYAPRRFDDYSRQ